MALNLTHQTGAQFAARLRARYRSATREDAARIAWKLIEMIAAGDVTDVQVRTAFGMTTGEYTAFKSRAQVAHDHWAAVLVAQGE